MALGRQLAAEFVGTFALVFAGVGAIMVDAQTHPLGHVGMAAAAALAYQLIRGEAATLATGSRL